MMKMHENTWFVRMHDDTRNFGQPRLHKRRLQKAKDDPHTQHDAEMAVGLATER